MGITDGWVRRRAQREEQPQPVPEPERLRPLTAAGRRVDLAHPGPELSRRKDWQSAAWGYRDTVPELRFTVGFISSCLGRLRVFPAANQPEGREPVALDEAGADGVSARTAACARDAIERVQLDSRGSSMLARLGENLEVAAEGYLLGEPDPTSPTGEKWSVRSVTELQVGNDGTIRLVEPGARTTANGSGSRELDARQVELLRIWRPHPQYYEWPDSEMASVLDTAEELRLIDRLMRAQTRSRISSGQLLYVPEELSLSRAGGSSVTSSLPGTADDDDPFMEEFTAGLLDPIGNEDSPEAVVPLVLRGPALIGDQPVKDLMGCIPIPREDPAELNARRDQKVAVLARALNIPPEVITGLSVGNHWSSWLISADTVRNHIEPRAEVLCDSITSAYLRPMLREMGCPADEVARVVLWFDPSELIQNPDRGKDARDAHSTGALSDEALMKHLGFGEDDRPKLHERLFRALEARSVSDQQVPLMMLLAGMSQDDPLVVAALDAAAAGRAQRAPQVVNGGRPARALPSGPPQGEPPADPGPPSGDPVNASAAVLDRRAVPGRAPGEPRAELVRRTDTYRVPENASRELARIDAQLLTELLANADATVGRAVERAAHRARARAQRDPQLSAAFRNRNAVEVCAELGARLDAFTEDSDLDDSTGPLRELWMRATAAAAEAIAAAVSDLMRAPADPELTARLASSARDAWPGLDQALRLLIRDVLTGRHLPRTDRGEASPGPVPPKLIRDALGAAGGRWEGQRGTPPPPARSGVRSGGMGLAMMATGSVVAEVVMDSGGASLGYEWQYFGVTRVPFWPHRELSGARFSGWTDPKLATRTEHRSWIGQYYSPGDHDGCLCGFFPIWAVPKDPDEPRAQADAAALTERDSQMEARILLAEQDDLHPGRGTLPDGRTHAQAARDLHEELVNLRLEHIENRESG